MRSTAWTDPEVWTVLMTRCPVSAAFTAVAIVSVSRISPITITSGFSRRALRSAPENPPWLAVSISRWEMTDSRSEYTNSIGSSSVRTCFCMTRLMWLIMAASVVDLPLPVVPAIRMRPRGASLSLSSSWGRLSFTTSMSSPLRIGRIAADGPPMVWKKFTRIRPPSGSRQDASNDPVDA